MITLTVNVESPEGARKIESVLAALGYECTVSGLDEYQRAERERVRKQLKHTEAEVFRHLSLGRDLRRTKAAMGVSHASVKTWAESLRVRLGFDSLEALAAYARGEL